LEEKRRAKRLFSESEKRREGLGQFRVLGSLWASPRPN